MKWKTTTLADCCESIYDGDHQAPPKVERGIPFITISNINDHRIDFTNTLYTTREYYDHLDDKRKARKDDVLYSVVGSFGIPVFQRESQPFIFQRHIALLRPDKKKIVPAFLYYAMLNPSFFAQADTVAIGAAQRTITLSALRKMTLPLPDVNAQEKIVSLLEPYDRLIENHRRQIALLEEAAQRMYKEWFVKFHFPGWEKMNVCNGIPEGWKQLPFLPTIEIMSGGTPSTGKPDYYRGNIPFFTPKDCDDRFFAFNTEKHISEEGLKHCNSKLYPKNTIVITARGTVGKVVLLGTPMAMNQSCFAFRSDTISNPYFLYFLLRHASDELRVKANGGVFDTITIRSFNDMNILLPDTERMRQFLEIVTPMMEQMQVLTKEITALQEARDRLLPRLMDGEIEV